MSDSDETVCGNESGEENIENSPSILSNWQPATETAFSTEKDGKNSEKGEEKSDVLDGDVTVESQEIISPEFPLITRGLKRKEDFDDTEEETSNPKNINSKEFLSHSAPEREKNSNANIAESQPTADDDRRLEKMLTSVEDFANDIELNSRENVSDGKPLQDAKLRLTDIQKLLVETNRKNQAKRKTILPDAEYSQQLPAEKKAVILDLAQKQRTLLESFKRYKNIVQRLKAIKDLKNTSQNQPAGGSMAFPNSTHGGQPLNSSAQLRSSGQHSDGGVQAVSQNISTAPTCHVLTTPRVVTENVLNPAATKTIQQGSIKLVVPPQNLNSESDCLSTRATTASTARGSTQSTVSAQTVGNATSARINNTMALRQANKTNQIPSKNSSTLQTILGKTLAQTTGTHTRHSAPTQSQPLTIRESANQPTVNSTPSQITGNTMNTRPRTGINQNTTRSTISTNLSPSSTRPNQVFTNAINKVTVQATKPQDLSRHIPCISDQSAMNQNAFKPVANRSRVSGPNSSTFSAGTTPSSAIQHDLLARRPSSSELWNTDRQTSLLQQGTTTKQIAELSLEKLVKKGVLAPGKNVLTTESEGKLYSASLSDKGTIVSAGGEGFTSPRSWLKAILGSRRKVKNELAWKMVSYKSKPLLDHACTPVATKSSDAPANPNVEACQTQFPIQSNISQSKTRRELINNTRALKALLSNCRVLGISDEEVFPLEQQRKNFWDDPKLDVLSEDVLKALDF